MRPESRIGFEIAIGLPSVLLIFLRGWVLSRYKRARFGNTITNIALYITCLCVLGTNGCNIWASAKQLEYRSRTDVSKEPSTGLPLHLLQPALKISFALKIFYVVGLYAAKAAFLGIYVELEQHLEKRLKVAMRIAIWATVVAFIGNLLLTVLWCLPFHTNWTLDPNEMCSSLRSMTVVAVGTASNVITDLVIMAIPLFVLKTLPLRRREMCAIAFVFTLGCICVVASIVRFIYLHNFISSTNTGLPSQQNVIVYTSELEVVIAVWAGCLPTLRALLRRPSRHETRQTQSGVAGSMTSAARPSKRESRQSGMFTGGEKGRIGHQRLASPGEEEAVAAAQHQQQQQQEQVQMQQTTQAPPAYSGVQRNIGLARGFGYGTYEDEEEGRIGVAKSAYMLDDESDREGSDVELRTIPLSPRGAAVRTLR